MRIAVIGAGAIGCLYGGRLARAGHDVHFLMRRDLEAVRQRGLTITSCDGDFHLDNVQAYGDPAEIGPVDLVLCALKATAIDDAEALIRPCLGPETRLLTMMNGFNIEPHFARWFPPERILAGLAFVCCNRGEPGVIHHLDHGRVMFGHCLDDVEQAEQIAQLFAEADFETQVAASLLEARWIKLMWNIPFSTLAVSAGSVTTREILADEVLSELARTLIRETGQAANADGRRVDIEAMVDKMMTDTASMGAYKPSMLVDYRNRSPVEVEAILGEPLRRAEALGVPVPCMRMQYGLVRFLDRLNRGLVTPG